MKKKHAKKIREITDAVGQVTTVTHEWVPISGRDLLLSGYGKMASANDIDPRKEYDISIPVEHYHSVKKDLKRALKAKGVSGMVDYVRKIHHERVEI